MMYEVKWNDTEGRRCVETVDDLSAAMAFATALGIPVTINGEGIELVGTFGSAGVENGLLPNGEPYTWYKRRRP